MAVVFFANKFSLQRRLDKNTREALSAEEREALLKIQRDIDAGRGAAGFM
ncbi:MAG: hypothetical protein Q4G30_10360 [Actinomycetaceae bacterium]|nr:hypothetical protein [Actinomycetaceae bacterium]